jgi:hypothetical protein
MALTMRNFGPYTVLDPLTIFLLPQRKDLVFILGGNV